MFRLIKQNSLLGNFFKAQQGATSTRLASQQQVKHLLPPSALPAALLLRAAHFAKEPNLAQKTKKVKLINKSTFRRLIAHRHPLRSRTKNMCP